MELELNVLRRETRAGNVSGATHELVLGQNDAMRDTILNLERSKRKLQEDMKNGDVKQTKLNEQIRVLQGNRSRLEEMVRNLSIECDRHQKSLEESLHERDKASKRIRDHEDTITSLKIEIEAMQADLLKYRVSVVDYRTQVEELTAEREQLDSQSKLYKSSKDELTTKALEMNERLFIIASERDRLQTDCQNLQLQKVKLQEELEESRQKFQAQAELLLQTQQDKSFLEDETARKSQDVQRLEEELKASKELHKTEMKSMKEYVEELRQKIQKVESAAADNLAQATSEGKRADDAESQNEKLRKIVNISQTQLKDIQVLYQKASDTLRDETAEKMIIMQKLQKAQAERKKMANDLQEMTTDYKAQQLVIAQRDATIHDFKRSTLKLSTENTRLQSDKKKLSENLNSVREDLEKQMVEMQESERTLKTQILFLNQSMKGHSTVVKNLQNQIQVHLSKIKLLEQREGELKAEFATDKFAIEQKVVELQTALDKVQQKAKTRGDKVIKLLADLQNFSKGKVSMTGTFNGEEIIEEDEDLLAVFNERIQDASCQTEPVRGIPMLKPTRRLSCPHAFSHLDSDSFHKPKQVEGEEGSSGPNEAATKVKLIRKGAKDSRLARDLSRGLPSFIEFQQNDDSSIRKVFHEKMNALKKIIKEQQENQHMLLAKIQVRGCNHLTTSVVFLSFRLIHFTFFFNE